MNKKYFDTKKDSLEHKINTIASEQPSISKPVSDVKLAVDKKYFESKKGSLEDVASKLVESKVDTVKENPALMAIGRTAAAAAGTAAGTAVGNKIGDKITSQKKVDTDQKKDFKSLRQETKLVKLGKNGKTDTGEKAAVIDLEPSARPI